MAKVKTKASIKAAEDSKKLSAKKKKKIHEKIMKNKPYVEFFTAFLSIPVMITVIMLNFNSLKNLGGQPTPTPTAGQTQPGFFAAPVPLSKSPQLSAQSLTPADCVKGLGPVSIDTPNEGDSITENPVVITINYDSSKYCGAAWSYRINGGSWSGYSDTSVALYNLPQGPVKFDLRVKSIVTADEKDVTRNFTYNGSGTVLIPTSATSSSSAR